MWRTKPPDAEAAAWGRDPESAANGPHLSGARGVGLLFVFGRFIDLSFLPCTQSNMDYFLTHLPHVSTQQHYQQLRIG